MNYWVIAFPFLMYLVTVGACPSPFLTDDNTHANGRYSDGNREGLSGGETPVLHPHRPVRHLSCVLLNFTFAQFPPHSHDCHATRTVPEEYPGRDGGFREV